MIAFDSPGAFAAFLRQQMAKIPEAEKAGLKAGIEMVQIEAQDMLGTYQTDTGPFQPWEPLSPVTQEERAEQGYSEDDPLLRSQVLQENIESNVGDREAATGVPDREVEYPYQTPRNIGEVAEDLENGTKYMSPRSFLGVAGFRKGEAAAEEVVSYVAWVLAGMSLAAKRPGRGGL